MNFVNGVFYALLCAGLLYIAFFLTMFAWMSFDGINPQPGLGWTLIGVSIFLGILGLTSAGSSIEAFQNSFSDTKDNVRQGIVDMGKDIRDNK